MKNEQDTRKLPPKQLERLRWRAVKAVMAGATRKEVGHALGVHPKVVGRWVRRYQQGGKDALKVHSGPWTARLTKTERLRRVQDRKNMATEIGKRIRDARERCPAPPGAQTAARGDPVAVMRVEDLAQMAGVAVGTITRIELGQKRPGVSILLRIADALGVSVTDLLPETGAHPRKAQALSRLRTVANQLSVREINRLIIEAESLVQRRVAS